jgi:hypothetical protein
MSNVTDARLEEDQKIREKMDGLEKEEKTDTEEYKKLYQEYYKDNDDIRRYWKTY